MLTRTALTGRLFAVNFFSSHCITYSNGKPLAEHADRQH